MRNETINPMRYSKPTITPYRRSHAQT